MEGKELPFDGLGVTTSLSKSQQGTQQLTTDKTSVHNDKHKSKSISKQLNPRCDAQTLQDISLHELNFNKRFIQG